MSQTLTLELSDQVYETIRRQAEAAATSPALLVVAALEEMFSGPSKEVEDAIARMKAMRQGNRHGKELSIRDWIDEARRY
jgi:predicted transcriptional regulator